MLISSPRPTQMLHFGQFALPCSSTGVHGEISFRHPGINGRMHLLQAYRSLPRPSSLIKPSHPPTGVFAPVYESKVSFDFGHPLSSTRTSVSSVCHFSVD
jgi:hypothetical protein